jgi:hypothetical protein
MDAKNNRAFYIVTNRPKWPAEGEQIHLYEVSFHRETYDIVEVKERIILKEPARQV